MSDFQRKEQQRVAHDTNWSAIFAVAFGVACMLTAELLPISLLTPMARGLRISDGMAGQSVSVVAFTAILSSLFVTTVARNVDRRRLLMAFSAVLAISCALVGFAPTFGVVLVGRVLLGLVLGGFWAMAASLAMRLAQPSDVPKALSIVFAGVSVSMVVAAPAGSLLEVVIGWRGVFGVAALLGVVCMVWQFLSLPSMPAPDRPRNVMQVFKVLKRPGVAVAMMTMSAVFAGQFSFFTFIRPLFEIRGGLNATGISLILVILGIANFVGTSFSSRLLGISLKMTLAIAPLLMAIASAGLLMMARDHVVAVAITALWGAAMGCVPVAWSTWVTRNLADDAENAGGLQVALIQLANMMGAAVGGMTYDAAGIAGPVFLGVGLLAGAALLVLLAVKVSTQIGSSVTA